MTGVALLFPGQGSQTLGMGRDIYEAFPEAREVMAEIEEAIKQPISSLMFEGPLDLLTQTNNAQPALLATAMMAQRVLEKMLGGKSLKDAGIEYVAGHSLGEYAALCAAGVFSIANAAILVKIRGNAMQRTAPGLGAMAAILGLELKAVEALCAKFSLPQQLCVVANDNAPDQVVVSGHKQAVEDFVNHAKEHGARRGVILPVSGPFHSPLMTPVGDIMYDAVNAVSLKAPEIPVFMNVVAGPVDDPGLIPELLRNQITGRVRWQETVKNMVAAGCSTFIEMGCGKVLTNLVKRIAPEVTAVAFNMPEDLPEIMEIIS